MRKGGGLELGFPWTRRKLHRTRAAKRLALKRAEKLETGFAKHLEHSGRRVDQALKGVAA